MKKIFYIFILLLTVTCVPVNPFVWIEYVVPAGQHYSLPRATPPLPLINRASFNFKTDDSWVWETPEPSGFSKVGGIFWRDNHFYSSRLGFDGEKLGVLFYVNGVSPMDNPSEQMIRLWNVKIPHEYYCSTGYEQGGLFLHLSDGEGMDTVIRIKCSKPNWPSSFDQPYVGGRYTLDHDWKTQIKLN